jgi:hypothetical protein
MTFAHVAGVPVEELLPLASAGGGMLARMVWLRVRFSRRASEEAAARP